MPTDKLQAARYEFKYVIDENTARKVGEFVLAFLEPDRYTVGREGLGYAVHSLYLDSPNLFTMWAVLNGEKNRFKLRARFYDESGPVFCEIKRRVNLVILKQRTVVRRDAVQHVLEGAPPSHNVLVEPENLRQLNALRNFCLLRDRIHARPSAYTTYMREGYEKLGDNAVRVTLDRRLRASKYHGGLDIADVEAWAGLEMDGVVLELKFTDRFPDWMHTLVQWCNLTRTGFAKYVKCVSLVHSVPTHQKP
jgi:hypothetical protein